MKYSRACVWLVCAASVLAVSCSSRQSSKDTQSVSSSSQQDKAAAGNAQPQATQPTPQDDQAISYAKNPERFRQMPVVPAPFNLSNPKTANDFFDVGVHEDNLKHYDKAIDAYEQGLKLKPDWGLLALREAKDYKRLGQTDKAIAQLQRASKINPEYWDAYSELALTYKESGDTKRAIDAASKLLAFPPMQIPVHNQLGYWYEEIGETQNARREFEIYRDLSQKNKTEPQTERYQTAIQELKKLGG